MISRLALALMFLACHFPIHVFAGPAEDRANSVFSAISSGFTSAESLADGFQKPLLSDGGEMRTLDGERNFSTGVMCSSSNNYLSITGGIDSYGETSINVRFDTDMDGYQDIHHTFSSISGICANGFIQCNAGTWEGCRYQMWQMNSTGLYTIEVPDTDAQQMKACSCTNAACLPVPQDHLRANLEKLGTSIANTSQAYNDYYTISEVQKTDSEIRFFGQDLEDCYNSGSHDLSNYYPDPSTMKSDGTVASDSNHLYQLLHTSQPIADTATQELINCTINRDISVSESSPQTGRVRVYSQGKDYVRCSANFETGAVTCQTDGLRWRADLNNTIDRDTFCQNENTILLTGTSAWNNPPSSHGVRDPSIRFRMISAPTCANGLIGRFEVEDTVHSSNTRHYLARRFDLRWNACELAESVSNECSSLATNDSCSLLHELTDGVQTFENGVPTNTPVPVASRTAYSSTCSITVERDFFNVQRTYLCDTDNQPIDIDMSRFQEPTVTDNTASFSLGEGAAFSIDRPGPEQTSCALSCKVRRSSVDTSVNVSGIAALEREDQSRGDDILKQCVNQACPVDEGEVQLSDCECSNNFADAVIALQMLRLANQDLECANANTPPEECVGQIEVFKGREANCRLGGTQTAWRNCCNLGGKVFEEQYGNRMESQGQALSQMADTFDSLVGSNTQEVIDAFNEIQSTTTGYLVEDGVAEVMNWMFSPCAEDSGPAALITSDMCVKVGEECIEEWELVGCVQEHEVHCCFKSVLAKILHEQARPQFIDFEFGSASDPNCRGFTLDEFQAIDFSRIDFTELEDSIKTQSQSVIEENMQQGLQDLQNSL